MPPRRRAAAPPPIDVEAVRRKLAEGKIVRVGISRSAQFPDGGTGRVRRVGDPVTDGDEYVLVELSLNGTRDILPFTPSDLTPATRGRPPGSGTKAAASGTSSGARTGSRPNVRAGSGERSATPAPPGRAPAGGGSSGPPPTPAVPTSLPPDGLSSAQAAPAHSAGALSADGSEQPPAGSPRPILRASTTDPGTAAGTDSTTSAADQPVQLPAVTRSTGRSRRPAAVSITIATAAAEPTQWRIEARIGTKAAVKSAAVSAARVWELVQTLDNEPLSRAVGAILEEQRSAAQARADALASELAAVQAELQALPDARR